MRGEFGLAAVVVDESVDVNACEPGCHRLQQHLLEPLARDRVIGLCAIEERR
jgi:hypothetical protein